MIDPNCLFWHIQVSMQMRKIYLEQLSRDALKYDDPC